MKRVLMLGTFIEYFRDWLFNIISCSHFTHVRLLGWQNCLLCIWTPQERIKRTIRVDFWSSALLRFYIISSCFRGASSPAVKSMCESSSWPSELSKHQGTLWHPRSRKKVLDERKNVVPKKGTLWMLCRVLGLQIKPCFSRATCHTFCTNNFETTHYA